MPVSRSAKPIHPTPDLPALVDQLIRAKRKTIAIIVQQDGSVIVRAPLKAPVRTIRAFVESKTEWIKEKKTLFAQKVLPPVKPISAGDTFLVLGKEIPLHAAKTQRTAVVLQENGLFIAAKLLPTAPVVLENWYKAYARVTLTMRVDLLAAKHGFKYEKIRISSARTRWGSCSSRGVLSFTWRLVMAPLDVVDYVVIHELAHLKIKNHSAVFWAEVARLMPDYKRCVTWLKKNGHSLTLNGEK